MQPLKLIVIVVLPGRLQCRFYVASAIKGSVFVLRSCEVDNSVICRFHPHILIFRPASRVPTGRSRYPLSLSPPGGRDGDNDNRDRILVRPEANIFRFMCAFAQNAPEQGPMIESGSYSSSSSLRMKLLQHRRPGIAISFRAFFYSLRKRWTGAMRQLLISMIRIAPLPLSDSTAYASRINSRSS
jgi:hypothetical protein